MRYSQYKLLAVDVDIGLELPPFGGELGEGTDVGLVGGISVCVSDAGTSVG